ncbi:uncharacterized protein SPSK_03546 [Sporothrix schenckii 1099-18]|uniref:Uncharacterized protein n=1 Tax=Sporothrix schenckii 1099-18 TaxID=1397361 RepID=A0A0F2LWY3_SPOSC|nr:uncharacterized protein SPSK_03546 [Sporothrix schenckii 1099-18]KJR81957.1 hypothetical protein SPSK_03546 [Sporothrix schenckii 1099-18]
MNTAIRAAAPAQIQAQAICKQGNCVTGAQTPRTFRTVHSGNEHGDRMQMSDVPSNAFRPTTNAVTCTMDTQFLRHRIRRKGTEHIGGQGPTPTVSRTASAAGLSRWRPRFSIHWDMSASRFCCPHLVRPLDLCCGQSAATADKEGIDGMRSLDDGQPTIQRATVWQQIEPSLDALVDVSPGSTGGSNEFTSRVGDRKVEADKAHGQLVHVLDFIFETISTRPGAECKSQKSCSWAKPWRAGKPSWLKKEVGRACSCCGCRGQSPISQHSSDEAALVGVVLDFFGRQVKCSSRFFCLEV